MGILNRMWWELPQESSHEGIWGTIETLSREQEIRNQNNLNYVRLYGNWEIQGLTARQYQRTATKHKVKLNVIRSVCDTLQNTLSEQRVRPFFLTDQGSWRQQEKAKLLNKFVTADFKNNKIYSMTDRNLNHSCVMGMSFMKHFIRKNRVVSEIVFPNEVIIDHQETRYNDEPRQMFHLLEVPRRALMKLFPDFEKQIALSGTTGTKGGRLSRYSGGSQTDLADMLEVAEAYYPASEPGATDGVHAIAIRDQTLFQENEWDKIEFPFSIMRYSRRILGWDGIGIPEMIAGIQLEINELLQKIQHIMYMSAPKILKQTNTIMSEEHLNNLIMGVLEYDGVPPEMWQMGRVPQELFIHLAWLYQRAFDEPGVSQLSARAEVPLGLESGKAIRTVQDIQSKRHIVIERDYEEFHLDVARKRLGLIRELAAEGVEFAVKIPDRSGMSHVKWSDIDMDEDQWIMQAWPTNLLSKEPSARLQEVQELLQSGLVAPEDGLNLLDFPDLKKVANLYIAAVENTEYTIDEILFKGRYHPPEPSQFLEFGAQRFQMAYLDAKMKGAPPERLDLMLQWQSEAMGLTRVAQSAALAQQQALQAASQPQSQAQALPEAQPRSDLIANAPGILQ